MIPKNPALLAERVGPRKGAKAWDTAIMSIVGLIILAVYVVAGLDVRNGWIGAPLTAILMIVRVSLEDRTLQAELRGYVEYTQQTRYRLLPGVR